MRDVRFAEIPHLGAAFLIKGQRFNLVGYRDHERRDGVTTTLLVWKSHCAECGQPFETCSPALQLPESRRCKPHRAPGRKVAK